RSFADQDVIGKPSVQMDIIVRKKSVYVSPADVLLVQVEHLDIRVILKDHTCNDFVADLQRFARAVCLYVPAHLDDLAGSLVSERYRDQSERVSLELMGICPADTASFYFYEDISVSHFRDREFLDVIMLK